ncbi:MAG: type II toxin-antitoxin system YafQ family toxin [Geminicoccaceae bacterium]
MRKIERTTRFKRDYKREAKGRHRDSLDRDLLAVVGLLARDAALPVSLRDHALAGDWQDHRDCHIKPDLVLILPQAYADPSARLPRLAQRVES